MIINVADIRASFRELSLKLFPLQTVLFLAIMGCPLAPATAETTQLQCGEGLLVIGSSLLPAVRPGGLLIYDGVGCPQADGPYLVFRHPAAPGPIVKAVIGRPGQIMHIGPEGLIYIDGHIALGVDAQPVAAMSGQRLLQLYEGPLEGFLVAGIQGSLDSRRIGLISRDQVLGYAAGIDDISHRNCMTVRLPVRGRSMEPVLQNGQKVTVIPIACRRTILGQVMAFRRKDEVLVKMVVGVPGQELRIDHFEIFIDGRPVKNVDGTLQRALPAMRGVQTVLDGYWVVGNAGSVASNAFGEVPLTDALGIVTDF